MSPRLTKPGLAAALPIHPFTGLTALGVLPSGKAVWPVRGGSSDDPNDPAYTGEDDEDDSEEDEEDEDEDEDPKSRKKRPAKKTSKSGEDDDDEEDDEEDSRIHRASEQAKRYRLALRAKEREFNELKNRLRKIEDDNKPNDEIAARDIAELRDKNETLNAALVTANAQLAFFRTKVPGVTWIDPGDAFALADRAGLFDDAVDDDGNVDERELRRGLKDLAKRKPHLVVKVEDDPKAGGRKSKDTDEDEEDDEDEPRSPRSGSAMNGKRKGTKGTTNRAALAKKFPVLNSF